jgi:hypothetical protein
MAYRVGDHFAICDICGFRRYASEMRMTWNNLFSCADTCWEPKHPQYKNPTGQHEKQRVEISRPEKADKFRTTPITADDL